MYVHRLQAIFIYTHLQSEPNKSQPTLTRIVFAYPDIRYPDLFVNFMAAKNPDILK